MRLFTGMRVNGIEGFLQKLSAELRSCGSGRFTPPANMHITLNFLGETDFNNVIPITRAITAASAGAAPFPLRVSGILFFGRGTIAAAQVQDESGGLSVLQKRLTAELLSAGFPGENRPYRPHITLARDFRGGEKLDRLTAKPPASDEFWVDEIVLFESTRASGRLEYVPIFTQQLGGD